VEERQAQVHPGLHHPVGQQQAAGAGVKGEGSDQNRAKRMALDAWVWAVNSRGGLGTWCWV